MVAGGRPGAGPPALLGGLFLMLVAGCGDGGRPGREDRPQITPREPDLAQAGSITGVARWRGDPPRRRRLSVSTDRYCQESHDGPVLGRRVVVEDGRLKNLFVWISRGLEEYTFAWRDKPRVMDQRGCRFEPHVLGAMVWQPVEFRNSDGTNHNVNSLGSAAGQGDNFSMTPASDPVTRYFPRPELMMKVHCDIHPWMNAYLCVVEHPYYAVTDTRGRFVLEDLPPGTYDVSLVHERRPGTPRVIRGVALEPGARVELDSEKLVFGPGDL